MPFIMKKRNSRKKEHMQNNKKVLIIYTGGTIGMSKTDNGYAPEMNTFLEMVNKIDELKNPKMPKWDIISLHPILDSSNISLFFNFSIPFSIVLFIVS